MMRRRYSQFIFGAAFSSGYFVAAQIGFLFEIGNTTVSPVWPAAGVALGALLVQGYRMTPWIFAGSFFAYLVHLTASGILSFPLALAVSTMTAIGVTSCALCGAFLVKTFIRKKNVNERVTDVVKFVILAAIASTTIGATDTILALGAGGLIDWNSFGYLWWTLWTGQGVGILLVVPVMIACCTRPSFLRDPRRMLEAALLFELFFIVHQIAVGRWLPALGMEHPWDNILEPFFLFLLLVAVVRFEQIGASAFVFLAWILLAWDTSSGVGPFVGENANEALLTLQASLGLLAVTFMFIVATMNELHDVVARLKKSKSELEERVRQRTRELSKSNLGLEKEINSRKHAQELLLESSQKLKAQYKGIPIPTYTWQKTGDDFTLVDYNDAAEEITSGAVKHLIGKSARDLYEDNPEILEDMITCYKQRSVVKREMLYRFRANDDSKYLATSYAFVPPDLVLAHTEDINDRKLAEAEVLHQRAALEERTADLAALNEVSAAISKSIDLDQLLRHVLRTITKLDLFKVEQKGGVFIVEGDHMRLAAHMGHPGYFLNRHRDMKVGDCLCGLSAQTGEIIISDNSEHDHRHTVTYPGMKAHGHVIVPLKVANRVVGVTYLYCAPDAIISERMINLLTAIGNQLGIAIENARLFAETKNLSLHDPLTGLANRNLMKSELAKAFAQSQRFRLPLSIIMMDLDHFKEFNDTYGHAAGDQLLVDVGAIIGEEIRTADVAVRFGGEEFIVILPNTDTKKASEVAERLRSVIAAREFSHHGDPPLHVTVSLGVAAKNDDVAVCDRLIMMADDALYEAKKNGRNRVVVWQTPRIEILRQSG